MYHIFDDIRVKQKTFCNDSQSNIYMYTHIITYK